MNFTGLDFDGSGTSTGFGAHTVPALVRNIFKISSCAPPRMPELVDALARVPYILQIRVSDFKPLYSVAPGHPVHPP